MKTVIVRFRDQNGRPFVIETVYDFGARAEMVECQSFDLITPGSNIGCVVDV